MSVIRPPFTLFFIRHGKLDLPYRSHAAMPPAVLHALGARLIDPALDAIDTNLRIDRRLASKIPLEKISHIFASPAQRCQETAHQIKSYITQIRPKTPPALKIIPSLQEVHFDLRDIIMYNKYRNGATNIAELNQAVLRAIALGSHSESYAECLQHFRPLFTNILPAAAGPAIIVTHDFLMRIIEIYIRYHGAPPPIIAPAELFKTQRNDYLRGFATNQSLTEYQSI